MKNLHVKHFILIALFLALIVQVFNTSSLYMSFSHLENPYKQIAGYFIALSAEFSIFICIYAGSRSAGAWFAVITFFCGILFHNHWKEVEMNFNTLYFYFPTPFLSSTLLQFMNSILVWFLSELYIEKRNAVEVFKSVTQLQYEKTVLTDSVTEINKHIAESKDYIYNLRETESELASDLQDMYKDLSTYEQRKEKLQQEITTLQKQKAGASKGVNILDNDNQTKTDDTGLLMKK